MTVQVAHRLTERAAFLAAHEPFRGLGQDELERTATSLVERAVPAGETVLVESGIPGTELHVVRDGTFEPRVVITEPGWRRKTVAPEWASSSPRSRTANDACPLRTL